MAPAFNFGLVAILGLFREIFSSDPPGFAMLPGEFFSDKWIAWHPA
jgi:hypothetical protein